MAAWLLGIGYERWALTALLVIPLAGAVLVMAGPAVWAKTSALAVTVVELVVSLGLWVLFEPSREGMQFEFIKPFQTVAGHPPRGKSGQICGSPEIGRQQ